jgi:hypothetical protein
VPSAAIETLEQFLEASDEAVLDIQLEDTGETLSLTREEAAYLAPAHQHGCGDRGALPAHRRKQILIYLTTLFEAFVLDSNRAVMYDVARDLRYGEAQAGAGPSMNDLLVRPCGGRSTTWIPLHPG